MSPVQALTSVTRFISVHVASNTQVPLSQESKFTVCLTTALSVPQGHLLGNNFRNYNKNSCVIIFLLEQSHLVLQYDTNEDTKRYWALILARIPLSKSQAAPVNSLNKHLRSPAAIQTALKTAMSCQRPAFKILSQSTVYFACCSGVKQTERSTALHFGSE